MCVCVCVCVWVGGWLVGWVFVFVGGTGCGGSSWVSGVCRGRRHRIGVSLMCVCVGVSRVCVWLSLFGMGVSLVVYVCMWRWGGASCSSGFMREFLSLVLFFSGFMREGWPGDVRLRERRCACLYLSISLQLTCSHVCIPHKIYANV